MFKKINLYILMIIAIILLTSIVVSNAFVGTMRYNKVKYQMSIWDSIDKNFKDVARKWFIYRAEKAGIDWYHLVEQNKMKMNFLEYMYKNIENDKIKYPEYYIKPFHGYDKGNLNWNAALEGDAATLSIAVNYWKNNDPHLSEQWLRYNITKNIDNYYKNLKLPTFNKVLDVGCSIGVSTEYISKSYPDVKDITGIDLSPYFLAIATFNSVEKNLPIKYYHRLAENTQFDDSSYDFIICNFLLHEVPTESTKLIINELHRILKPNGVLAIVDLDPKNVQNKLIVSAFRKWAFEVTEPHISDYYDMDLNVILNNNFINVKKCKNDPVNSIWFGQKKGEDVQLLEKNLKTLEYKKLDNTIPPFTLESKLLELI